MAIDPLPEARLDPSGFSSGRPPAALPQGPGRALPKPRRTDERDVFQDMPELELAPDWFRRIRMAREKLNWTPEELGKRLNEKKSVILKMESGSFRPPDESIRKIERLLKIRLRADAETAAAS